MSLPEHKPFFSFAATLQFIQFVDVCFWGVCGYVPSYPHTNSQDHIQTYKPDQTKINIYGIDMANSAAQLVYGPVLVSCMSAP